MFLFNASATIVGTENGDIEAVEGVFDLPDELALRLVSFPEWEVYTGQTLAPAEPTDESAAYLTAYAEGTLAPPVPVVPVDLPTDPSELPSLAEMSRDELLAYADNHGITVKRSFGEARLREAIVFALVPDE